MNMNTMTSAQLRRAAAIRERIENAEKEFRSVCKDSTDNGRSIPKTVFPKAPEIPKPKRRRISPAARDRISSRMKELWRERRQEKHEAESGR